MSDTEIRHNPTEPDRLDFLDESQASLVSSIKTSIDDETLMELAKKGIQAMTPVNAKSKQQKALGTSKTQDNFTDEQKKTMTFAQKLPDNHLSGKTQQTNSNVESQVSGNHHLHSTLHEQESTKEVNNSKVEFGQTSRTIMISDKDAKENSDKAALGSIGTHGSERNVILSR